MTKLKLILVACFVALGSFTHATAPELLGGCRKSELQRNLGKNYCKATFCRLLTAGHKGATLKDVTLPATKDSCAVAVTGFMAPSYIHSTEMKATLGYLESIGVAPADVAAFPAAAVAAYSLMLQHSMMKEYYGRSLVRHSTSVMEQLQNGVRMFHMNIDWDASSNIIMTTTSMVATNNLQTVLRDIDDFLSNARAGGMNEFVLIKLTNKYVGDESQMKGFAAALATLIRNSFTTAKVYNPTKGVPTLEDLVLAPAPQVLMYTDATAVVEKYPSAFFGPAEMPLYYGDLQQSSYGLMKSAAAQQKQMQADNSPNAVRVIPFTFAAEPFNLNFALLGLLAQPSGITRVGWAVIRNLILNKHTAEATALKTVLDAVAKSSPLPQYVDDQRALTQNAFNALEFGVEGVPEFQISSLLNYPGAPKINALPLFTVGYTDYQWIAIREMAMRMTLSFNAAPNDDVLLDDA